MHFFLGDNQKSANESGLGDTAMPPGGQIFPPKTPCSGLVKGIQLLKSVPKGIHDRMDSLREYLSLFFGLL